MPESGQKILQIKKFSLEEASDNSIIMRMIDNDGNMLSKTIYYHSK